ncbi:hypothetical protein ACSBM8_01405 [Sphingomonas sp. ASY06-1R]|uniref:hypothetical protein n=1 Tax=Sphingomonas sp. ASY06-1R TaxID=3445771 RepID=UPI003FA2F88A
MTSTLPRFFVLIASALLTPCAAMAQSGAEDGEDIALTPETLGDVLSCRSHPGAFAFASALFLEDKPPAWMRKIKDDKATEGMIGLYGFTLAKPAALLGEQVTTVYFLQDWVVTLWPRAKALAFIQAQKMERAPIKATEQYYRFIDPDSGPMLGAFEPTGGALSAMLAKAFGAEEPSKAPPSDRLFVGCNYTTASQADFLAAAGQADAMTGAAAKDIAKSVSQPDRQ